MGKIKNLLINTEPTDFIAMADIINNALFSTSQRQDLQNTTNQEIAQARQYNIPQTIYLLMRYDLADRNPATNTKIIGTYTDGDTADYDMYLMREGDCALGEYNYEYGIVQQTLNTYKFESDNQSF
jgi:hypothetical protein